MKTTLSIILLLFITQIYAQDVLYLKNGETKNVSITNKNKSNISYKIDSLNNGDTIFKLKLSKIDKIIYSNGNFDPLNSLNPRNIYRLGVSGGLRNTIMFLNHFDYIASIDYFISPKVNAEFSIIGNLISPKTNSDQYIIIDTDQEKIWTFLKLGMKYWLASTSSKSGLSPYVGLLLCKDYAYYYGQLPIGISYISKSGFQSGLEINAYSTINSPENFSGLNIEFRVGWRFKTKKH